MNPLESPKSAPRMRRLALAVLPVLALTVLGGCVVAPAPYAVATVPPPAPVNEVVGVAPYPGYVWIGGYWGWGGGRYVWHPGRWAAPRPGYYWVPHRWIHRPDGWYGERGHWQRR